MQIEYWQQIQKIFLLMLALLGNPPATHPGKVKVNAKAEVKVEVKVKVKCKGKGNVRVKVKVNLNEERGTGHPKNACPVVHINRIHDISYRKKLAMF